MSYASQGPKDDGVKLMNLNTKDAVAILGYAGLGATSQGTQPSEWMLAALRGRNLSLEESLGALANAIKLQFPHHLKKMPNAAGPA